MTAIQGPSLLEEHGRAVRSGRLSARAGIDQALERLASIAGLNACTEILGDDARACAETLDERRERGERLGLLAGVPFAVKANIATRAGHSDCASTMLREYVSPSDASAVARLLAEDAILVAKTNCDEFGMGSSTEHSSWGPTLHPEDAARVPGGSSGGSAVAVSARGGGALPLALGSDTGGSLRQPAAFCGVVGLKPTYGRVSRWGLVAFASSMDQIGPITRRVRDAALALEIMAGPDGRDARCLPDREPGFVEACERGVEGLRAGLVGEGFDVDEVGAAARALAESGAETLENAGARVEDLALPEIRKAVAIYALSANAEASSNLARFEGVRFGERAKQARDLEELYESTRAAGFGTEVKRRVLLGTFALSREGRARFLDAAGAARRRLRAALDEALSRLDVLIMPTAPGEAFRLGELKDRPLERYRSDMCTLPASLGGHPALSIPGPRRRQDALPLGLQLVAARGQEQNLFAAASALEERGFAA